MTTRLSLSRLMSVVVCLCAFACLPVPQVTSLTWAEAAETECPVEEDGESAEKELAGATSNRRRLHSQHTHASRFRRTSGLERQAVSYGNHPQAIIGHQLANGLRAPLTI